MALGVIEECLALSVDYAKKHELWGQRIGNVQLIQLKLAKMEIARLDVQNMVLRTNRDVARRPRADIGLALPTRSLAKARPLQRKCARKLRRSWARDLLRVRVRETS